MKNLATTINEAISAVGQPSMMWKSMWHRFIDHPADGLTLEEALTKLRQLMDIPQPPKLPTRSEVWHGAHTQVELKIYERELDEYLKQKIRYYKLIQRLST